MGLTLSGRYISLFLAVQIAYLLQAVGAAGKCDTVFKGFSNCLLQLGDNMGPIPTGAGREEKPRDHLHEKDTLYSSSAEGSLLIARGLEEFLSTKRNPEDTFELKRGDHHSTLFSSPAPDEDLLFRG
ncbi:hypothetical protein SRHO_G00050880 [Serrasalmus rhombeus]